MVKSIAVAVWMICFALPAFAGTESDGRPEFERAARYYRAQEYEAALPWFQRAYELSKRRPSAIRALAQCERSLHRYDDAIAHFREYLATNPPEEDARAVRETIVLLEELKRPDILELPKKRSAPPVKARELLPPMARAEKEIDPNGALPWITIGGSSAVAIFGMTLFAMGQSDISRVEGAREGSRFAGELSEAADRAPVLTGVGTGMLIAGLAGAGAGVVWLLDRDQ
jgi:tetratricopeptide (TPR) repeat protein